MELRFTESVRQVSRRATARFGLAVTGVERQPAARDFTIRCADARFSADWAVIRALATDPTPYLLEVHCPDPEGFPIGTFRLDVGLGDASSQCAIIVRKPCVWLHDLPRISSDPNGRWNASFAVVSCADVEMSMSLDFSNRNGSRVAPSEEITLLPDGLPIPITIQLDDNSGKIEVSIDGITLQPPPRFANAWDQIGRWWRLHPARAVAAALAVALLVGAGIQSVRHRGTPTTTTAPNTIVTPSTTGLAASTTTPSTTSTTHQLAHLTATALTLLGPVDSISAGTPVTFTADIAPAVGGSQVIAGLVDLLDGSTHLDRQRISDNQVSFHLPALSFGSHTLQAHYEGSSSFGSTISAVVVEQVQPLTAQLTINVSDSPCGNAAGRMVMLMITVSSQSNVDTPTGTVTVPNIAGPATITLDFGQATTTIGPLPGRTYAANYSGGYVLLDRQPALRCPGMLTRPNRSGIEHGRRSLQPGKTFFRSLPNPNSRNNWRRLSVATGRNNRSSPPTWS
jgi:Bacterial Ig-like domain (group 3)